MKGIVIQTAALSALEYTGHLNCIIDTGDWINAFDILLCLLLNNVGKDPTTLTRK